MRRYTVVSTSAIGTNVCTKPRAHRYEVTDKPSTRLSDHRPGRLPIHQADATRFVHDTPQT